MSVIPYNSKQVRLWYVRPNRLVEPLEEHSNPDGIREHKMRFQSRMLRREERQNWTQMLRLN
jgi:hypothetical protein